MLHGLEPEPVAGARQLSRTVAVRPSSLVEGLNQLR